MVYEDFTTYAEVDPNNHISKTAHHIDHDAYENEDAYVYKDKGTGHFTDFEHKIDIRIISWSATYLNCPNWMLSNDVDDLKGLHDAGKTCITTQFYRGGGTTKNIRLREDYGGVEYKDEYDCTENTWYYLTIEKNGTSLTCKIYSDSDRTNLLDTLSLTLHADHSFRYIFATTTENQPQDKHGVTEIENLDLQELVLKEVSDSLGLSDNLLRDKTFAVSDSLDLSDELLRDKSFTIADSMGLSDELGPADRGLVLASDVIELTESMLRDGTLTVTDNISLSDYTLRDKSFTMSDTISLAETIIRCKKFVITDAISISDITDASKIFELIDIIKLSDSVLIDKILSATDYLEITDVVIVAGEKLPGLIAELSLKGREITLTSQKKDQGLTVRKREMELM